MAISTCCTSRRVVIPSISAGPGPRTRASCVVSVHAARDHVRPSRDGFVDAPRGTRYRVGNSGSMTLGLVLDTAESERAVLFGIGNHGPIATLFAASHPIRTRGWFLPTPWFQRLDRRTSDPTAPVSARDPRMRDQAATQEFITQAWGTPAIVDIANPDAASDHAFRAVVSSLEPTGVLAEGRERGLRMGNPDGYPKHALPSVGVPTLVLHREDCQAIPLDQGRYLAAHIPGARLVVLPGRDISLFTEPSEPGLQQVEEFLAGLHGPTETDRALAAILSPTSSVRPSTSPR